MNIDLLKRIVNIDGFVCEKTTEVDGMKVYIRPLYVELLALYPKIQKELADEISEQIIKRNPEVLYTVEASVLPIATLVANNLCIPMSIIRKSCNFKHEVDEPSIFLDSELIEAPAVLLDDAIWSGRTIHNVFRRLEWCGVKQVSCYFIFDFLNFNGGGRYLDKNDLLYLQRRECWTTYREALEMARHCSVISDMAYSKTIERFV